MPRLFKKMSKKIGQPPGTLMHIGEEKTEKVKITIIDYDRDQLNEQEVENIEDCFPYKDTETTTWININGIHEVDVIEKIGGHFGIHPLFLEDVVNSSQRPMIEDFEDFIFLVLKMLTYDEELNHIKAEQVSMLLGKNYVISFQEREGDVFNIIRERLRKGKGRIRKSGADYLAYALADAIIDHYFLILENLGETIEGIEEELINNPIPKTLETIHQLKREMIFMRKSVWPLREVINGLERSESSLIHESTYIYLRDVYDHTIQVIDTIETFRDMISGMLDIYLTSISNKMNTVMKVLTIIATIFIPLTFVAGIYGMNFKYMPELEWRWGYFAVLFVMLVIGIGMGIFFKNKKWL
ncbi:magnesium/cobalt transporter CorA [Thermodesulfobacteriota bacterium]